MLAGLADHIERYIELNEEDKLILSRHFTTVALKRKDFLLKEGKICDQLFFIKKGCVRMYFVNQKGVEQITQFAIENWWISDLMSFEMQKPSSFYIQAIDSVEVYAVTKSSLEAVTTELPKMERYFRHIFQRAYAAAQHKIKYLRDLSKEESYEQFVAAFPGFVQRIPQYMLASYLGFTPEYLSEIRKKIH